MKPCLTLFVPSNSEWVASPGPSDIGAKKSKVGMGQKKKQPTKMLTFWLLTLQCCHHSLTILLSSQIYSEPSPIHCPHHQLYAGCHRPWKVYIQCFRKLISLTSHCIFADLIASRMQEEVIEFFFSFTGRKFVLEPVSVWLCFPRQQK